MEFVDGNLSPAFYSLCSILGCIYHSYKMVAVACSSGTKYLTNTDLTLVTNDYKCICCQHLQRELTDALLELQSARKIIELLREETYSTAPSTSITSQGGRGSHVSGKIISGSERNTTANWKKVNYTRREFNRQPKTHPRQPIPIIVNRYTLPVNHRMDLEDSQSPRTTEKTSVRINSKVIQKPQKTKILIIGDSHVSGCAAELSSTLGEIKGTVMPGFRLEHITSLARREISRLHRNDFVVICGGANDISKNESNIGLRHLRKFALCNEHTTHHRNNTTAQV